MRTLLLVGGVDVEGITTTKRRARLAVLLAFAIGACAAPSGAGLGVDEPWPEPDAKPDAEPRARSTERAEPPKAKDAAPTSPPANARRLALVVGVSRYGGAADLANPVNDANAMAGVLERVGFQVTKLIDVDRAYLKDALAEFEAELGRGGGVGLFYFAGHGLQDGELSYLMPAGSAPFGDDFRKKAVSLNDVLNAFTLAKNRLSIVVLDACRTPPRAAQPERVGQTYVEAPAGTLIAYATAPGQSAWDGEPETHGVYTGALLEEIVVPGAKLENVFRATRAKVYARTGQLPWEATSVLDDFFFVPSADGQVAPEPPPIAMTPGVMEGRARGPSVADGLVALTSAQLTAIEKQIASETHSSAKLAFFEFGTRNRSLTIAQLGRLLEGFGFEVDRLAAARMVRRQVTDPEAAAQLAERFAFGVDRDAVIDLFAQPPEAELDAKAAQALFARISSAGHARARLDALTEGVRGKSLSIAQMRRLLDAFRATQEKLEALRVVRRQIRDPENAAALGSAFRDARSRSEAKRIFE